VRPEPDLGAWGKSAEPERRITRGIGIRKDPIMSAADDGRKRIVIDRIAPQVDCGRFPIKRAVGEMVAVRAHVFGDGHDRIRVELMHRHEKHQNWAVEEMTHCGNDEWTASFTVTELGSHLYTVRAYVDRFDTWQADLNKRIEAGQDVALELQIGAEILRPAAKRADASDAWKLQKWAEAFCASGVDEATIDLARSAELTEMVRRYPDRSLASVYEPPLQVSVDRPKAVFSSWYELFPRSLGGDGEHGTFRDCEHMLVEIAKMGFDVLYLPPIHPIGETNRKGKNNSAVCQREDPGSPWAIGSAQGDHKTIHPELGSLADFHRLLEKAREHGLEVAIDLAFQCSPDHPYVKAHREWFRWRPDGTVQYAENPPKKYEDILPLNFETDQWKDLWEELKSVVLFWIDQGVRIFRVDNPHTKPFGFWEWLIGEVRRDWPDVVFLSEAFTRPKVMQRLAKAGFNQSYTYFTWRNTKWELEHYIHELTETEVGEYLRPNFWPNTPDILPQYLQYGGRAAFIIRLVLAATLSASYGVYGPAFELCVTSAIEGKEEYLDSEKYELKQWDWNSKDNIRAVIERLNRIRRQNPSLQRIRNIRFYPIDNENMLCYGKVSDDASNVTVVVVSIDPHYAQSGWVELPLETLGIDPHRPYLMHDLLSDDKYIWHGRRNYVELDPQVMPAHILRLRKEMRRESDFDYFM
jgi:starch synthase (maltosyl-transferring)